MKKGTICKVCGGEATGLGNFCKEHHLESRRKIAAKFREKQRMKSMDVPLKAQPCEIWQTGMFGFFTCHEPIFKNTNNVVQMVA